MLLETLYQACRSALDVLEPAVSGDLIACELTQIAERDLGFPMVAAAHYTEGPIRRLVVGCEPRLAEHLAGVLPRSEAHADDSPQRAGLAALCEQFRRGLVARGLPGADEQGFIVHDSERFRVCSEGARNFHLRAAAAEGRIDLLLDLAEPKTDDEPLKFGAAAPGKALTDPTLIARIMAALQHSCADVQLKLPDGRGGETTLPGTVVAMPDADVPDRVTLTYAGSAELSEGTALPSRVKLTFVLHRRLLEAVCETVDVEMLALDEDLFLPVLHLRHPAAVAGGQRRGALRVEPARPVNGTLQRVVVGDDGVNFGGKDLPIRVLDISATGVRVIFRGGVMVSGFRWGTAVACRLDLPEPHGAVEVRGEVRRIDLHSDGQGLGDASVGVEFCAETAATHEARETIRRFVADCQEEAEALTGGIVLSPSAS